MNIAAVIGARVTVLGLLAAWIAHYVSYYPPANLLWTCNVGWIAGALGIAFGNAVLVSAALIITLIPDVLWIVDVAGRLVADAHPIGGTEYLFDPRIPASVRLLSWEHAILPPLLVVATGRLGYRAVVFAAALPIVLAIYYASYLLADPAWHVNYVRGLFGRPQSLLPDALYPALAATVFWLALAGPVHLVARRWLSRS